MAFGLINASSGKPPGSRTQRLAGYLKTANEIRQSYFSRSGNYSDDGRTGRFAGANNVRKGDQELLVFPSYARDHIRPAAPSATQSSQFDGSEQEYWHREWTRHQNDNAVVDVDLRGLVVEHYRGPPTRKHRILIGIAKSLSGLVQMSPSGSTKSSEAGDFSRSASPTRPSPQDREVISQEAARIIERGEMEQRNAQDGRFSENPGSKSTENIVWSDIIPNTSSQRPATSSSTGNSSSSDGLRRPSTITRRWSWPGPGGLTPEERAAASERLMERLKPFMASSLPDAPIKAVFYNDTTSREHTLQTDAAGHFAMRAMLNFVPTHVHVSAGQQLSLTEEVKITNHQGVSLISDVDDTIKHSGITGNARQIFRNVFVRDLSELTIEGVREWYGKMDAMNVPLHYVSNSPWQLYPVMAAFFKMARLPTGSFHLKQYAGLFQGIFEPVAERKKSSLVKIFTDFPERKFILVGDSGEADLEIYTTMALEYPGRVLGIFIRDVTTRVRPGFFESLKPPKGVPPITRPPLPPPKPEALRVASSASNIEKPAPPPIRKPSSSISPFLSRPESTTKTPPPLPPRPNIRQLTGEKLKNAYRAFRDDLTPPRSSVPVTMSLDGHHEGPDGHTQEGPGMETSRAPPPLPPRRRRSSLSLSSLRKAAALPSLFSRRSSRSNNNSNSSSRSSSRSRSSSPMEGLSRKEFAWKERWRRAQELLESQRLTMRTWRVGGDVEDVCVRLTESAMRDVQRR